jgi:diacylglycerol kinase (ATP)
MEKRSTRVCFIVNPAAGKNRSVQFIDWLNREAGKRWLNFEISITRKNESVIGLARSKARIFDIVVACGGDGTINQVVNGIEGTGCVLAVLPIGTGNDFVKSLALPELPEECLNLIYDQRSASADLIRCDGDVNYWCNNTLGVGLDGLANFYSKSYKKLNGPVIYILGAIRAALKFRGIKFRLEIDGMDHSDHYLMITACNGKWEGGQFFLAPEASLFDGLFDVVTIKKISLFNVFRYLISFKKGPAKWMTALESRKAKSVTFNSSKPVAVHADGEHLGTDISRLNIRIVKGAIEVITGH